MKKKLASKNLNKLVEKLCPECYSAYVSLLKEQVADNLRWERGSQGGDLIENDWDCSNNGELLNQFPLDRSIEGQEEEFEDEIDLYKTY
ncbi:MAG: hypothetical protein QGF46_09005, partial [Planctomycetota bacterium]|nr:hypothetical protein [Planctomycetota bacterium]